MTLPIQSIPLPHLSLTDAQVPSTQNPTIPSLAQQILAIPRITPENPREILPLIPQYRNVPDETPLEATLATLRIQEEQNEYLPPLYEVIMGALNMDRSEPHPNIQRGRRGHYPNIQRSFFNNYRRRNPFRSQRPLPPTPPNPRTDRINWDTEDPPETNQN